MIFISDGIESPRKSRKLLYWSPEVARLVGHGDLLGQAGAQGVGTGNDHTIVHAQFEEGVTHGADLGQEVLVGNGYLAVLVTALLLVGYLVLDLDGAGARLDHLLGQEVGRFSVTETGVDVSDDGYHVRLVVVDLVLDRPGRPLPRHPACAGCIQRTEQATQLAGVSLAQEGVQLLDQAGYREVFSCMDWSGRGPNSAAQGGDHPAGEVQVALVGGHRSAS